MSRFTGALRVGFNDTDDGRVAMLLEPLVWECDEKGSGLVISIPAGFQSDGASVPRPLWFLLPPWGDRATRAAILHDFICQELDAHRPLVGISSRADGDRQLYLALRALGVAPWRADLVWLGVRTWSISYALTGFPR